MKTKKQILVIHGGTTYRDHASYVQALLNKTPKLDWILSRRDWKNELQDQLGDNFLVYTPRMPESDNAQYDDWKLWFEKIVDMLEDDFFVIGHSLGGIFLAKYLSENKVAKRIMKTFLIAAPFDDEGMTEEPSACSFLLLVHLLCGYGQQYGVVSLQTAKKFYR